MGRKVNSRFEDQELLDVLKKCKGSFKGASNHLNCSPTIYTYRMAHDLNFAYDCNQIRNQIRLESKKQQLEHLTKKQQNYRNESQGTPSTSHAIKKNYQKASEAIENLDRLVDEYNQSYKPDESSEATPTFSTNETLKLPKPQEPAEPNGKENKYLSSTQSVIMVKLSSELKEDLNFMIKLLYINSISLISLVGILLIIKSCS